MIFTNSFLPDWNKRTIEKISINTDSKSRKHYRGDFYEYMCIWSIQFGTGADLL